MLKPLFSNRRDLAAWLLDDRFLFDPQMSYIGFVARGQAWTGVSGFWLGPVCDGHLYDGAGRLVAFDPQQPLADPGVPLPLYRQTPPVPPISPVRPVPPNRPLSLPGTARWSHLSVAQWLVAATERAAPVQRVANAPAQAEPEEGSEDGERGT